MKKIPIFWPFIPKDAIMRELSKTLSSRWIGQGPKVEKFEKEFGKKFGYKYPLFVNSGTAALEMAYHLIGIGPGDEVIVPILDCTAGQTGLLRRGAKIKFCDISEVTLNIDSLDLESKITDKTKAIVAVHLGGVPISKQVFAIGKKYKIPVIADAAQHHAPSDGDYVCYSFQAIKHITTGDGGMLVLRTKEEHHRAKLLRWFGIDRDQKAKKGWQPWSHRQMTFDIQEAGYKYQPTDIDASLGLASLPYLDTVIKYRQRLVKEYLKNLPPFAVPVVGGTAWLMGILVEHDRDELAEYLLKHGVEAHMVHLRNDIFKVFGGKRLPLENMNKIESQYLYLPVHTKVTLKDVQYICRLIGKFYGYRAN